MPTIRDVAKRAKVSVATVSRVLNGSSRVSDSAVRAVRQVQHELGFYLNANARALAHQGSETIGIIVADVSDPFFGAMVKSCENVAQESGCTLLVGQGFHDPVREQQAIENMLRYQCRALIIHALALPDLKMQHYLKQIPYMVLTNRIIQGFNQRCFNIDNYSGEYTAVRELIRCGHQRIAFINSSHQILDSKERLDGYMQALKDHGIEFDPELIVNTDPSPEGGAQAVNQLIARNVKFSAVACYCDIMAAGAVGSLLSHGYHVPDDVSITGFDDIPLARYLNPPLTTISNPVAEMTMAAAKLSMALYDGKESDNENRLAVELVRRRSIKIINQA